MAGQIKNGSQVTLDPGPRVVKFEQSQDDEADKMQLGAFVYEKICCPEEVEGVPALRQQYDRVLLELQKERDGFMAEKAAIMQ
eukprot:1097652-Pelagomonas_calceolata.AAC.7